MNSHIKKSYYPDKYNDFWMEKKDGICRLIRLAFIMRNEQSLIFKL